jgi:hypothetical protein
LKNILNYPYSGRELTIHTVVMISCYNSVHEPRSVSDLALS